MFLKNRNISSKIKRSKVTDYAALTAISWLFVIQLKFLPRGVDCTIAQGQMTIQGLEITENSQFFYHIFKNWNQMKSLNIDHQNLVLKFPISHPEMRLIL